jgi:hypothetical protein
MDPRTLFPILAFVFLVLALLKGVRSKSWKNPVSTWALLGLIFGVVSLWLHFAAR